MRERREQQHVRVGRGLLVDARQEVRQERDVVRGVCATIGKEQAAAKRRANVRVT